MRLHPSRGRITRSGREVDRLVRPVGASRAADPSTLRGLVMTRLGRARSARTEVSTRHIFPWLVCKDLETFPPTVWSP